jgi:hypothetical protein
VVECPPNLQYAVQQPTVSKAEHSLQYFLILTQAYSEFMPEYSRVVYRLLVGKPEGKRTLGRPRRRWMDNIKMDVLEIGLGVVDWIGLAQDRYR